MSRTFIRSAVILLVFSFPFIRILSQIRSARETSRALQQEYVAGRRELRAREGEAVIRERTSELRGLAFLKTVPSRTMPREEIKQFILDQVDELFTEQEIEGYQKALELFGVIPDGSNVMDIISEIYASEAGGFYDQRAGVLYRVGQVPMKSAVFAHEYTHSLQDQHFDLSKLPIEEKHNDDRATGALCLVEGDATLLTTEYMLTHPDVELVLGTVSSVTGSAGEGLRNAPPFFRDFIQFPYLKGTEMVAIARSRGGWEAVNRMYDLPPESTEQVLHPSKYFGVLDSPEEVDVLVGAEQIGEQCGGKWQEIYRNVMGEYATSLFLREHLNPDETAMASEGWDGDRYVVCRSGTSTVLSWSTTWDTSRDAGEFFEKMNAFAARETGAEGPILQMKDAAVWCGEKRSTAVRREQMSVHVLRSFSQRTLRLLIPALNIRLKEN